MTAKHNPGNFALDKLTGSERLSAELRAAMLDQLDPDGLFNIPFEDVRRAGSAVATRSDRITLGDDAKKAVEALQKAFCMPSTLPGTWGELMGLMEALRFVHNYSMLGAEGQEQRDAQLVEHFPELLTPAQAYRDGDRALLESYWTKVLPLDAMALHWDSEHGWAGLPRLRETRERV